MSELIPVWRELRSTLLSGKGADGLWSSTAEKVGKRSTKVTAQRLMRDGEEAGRDSTVDGREGYSFI